MNKTRLKVGTDFSGIGAPEMALNNLGIDYEQVFACEIDKHAKKSYLAIHGSPAKFYNDITQRDHAEPNQLDLYIAGFPCQPFSVSGQRKGFNDVRGTLFFDVAEFIRINQPKIFILENVKGLLSHDNGRTYQTITDILTNGGGTLNSQISLDVFDDGLGYHCYAQVMNTKDHGIPQSRERVFIVGFKEFRDFAFPKTEPLTTTLSDIIEYNVDKKYLLTDKKIEYLLRSDQTAWGKNFLKKPFPDVSLCIESNYCKGSRSAQILSYTRCSKTGEIINRNFKDVSNTLHKSTGAGGNTDQYIATTEPMIAAMRGRYNDKGNTEQKLEINDTGISNTITSVQKDNLLINKTIRRLTPLECWRLQAFPDEAFYKAKEVCSDTQLYRQAGNSISVNVIEKLLNKIL